MPNEFLKSGAIIQIAPDDFWIGVGKPNQSSLPPIDKPCLFAPDFFLEEEAPFFSFEHEQILSRDKLLSFIQPAVRLDRVWGEANYQTFKNQFISLKKLIDQKQLVKGVPYTVTKSKSSITSLELQNSLIALLSKPGKDFAYGIWEEEGGLLGVTPEILFDVKDKELSTMACGGTCALSEINLPLLKEKEEHRLIVEGIYKSLKSHGEPKCLPLEFLKLPSFAHLVTKISLTLKENADLNLLVKALHPTPALGAYPKEAGRQWLNDIDALAPRNRFGAPFAFISQGKDRMLCLVAIRNLSWNKQESSIFAGAGVTDKSDLELEWKEVNHKIDAVKARLAL